MMEQYHFIYGESGNNYVINVCFTYKIYLLMTFWLVLHRKNNIAALMQTWLIFMLGQIVASLLSLCMTKWLGKWRRGWRFVHSNTKNAKSLISNVYHRNIETGEIVACDISIYCSGQQETDKHGHQRVASRISSRTFHIWFGKET